MSEENVENVTAEVVEAAPQVGPGKRLREAREAAGFSREEVAARLRLRLDLIRALEEDDQASLPPATFVSGYLRSYARLLELPVDEIVGSLAPREEQTPIVSPVMPPRQRRSGDLPVKAVTYLIILALIALLTVWWVGRRPSAPTAESSAPEVVKPGGTVELALPPAAPEAQAPAEAAANGGAATTTESPAPAAQPDTSATKPQASVAPAAQAEIQLEVSADCWTEIKDATGSQVLFELLKAGSTRTVRGKAPFDIFLGYAPGVTVYYQGQVFDHSRFQRKDVARFHLGKASDNAVPAE